MKEPNHSYEPHLTIREFSVLPGNEWTPKVSGWSLIQVRSGMGYWLQSSSSTILESGAVILSAGKKPGCVRSSQLNEMSLCRFCVMPSRLTGLITIGEQDLLKGSATRGNPGFRMFPAGSSVAMKMGALCADRKRSGLSFRLALLQLFAEVVGGELEEPPAPRETPDAKERLKVILRQTPPDELLELTFVDLANKAGCTSRHLSRIFYQVVGMSFRDKIADIRLARARELLATSQSKVVEVALESGYRSLSLFNLMFSRRFGTSPGRWRKKNASKRTR